MKNKNLKEYFGTQRPSFAGGPGAGSNFYSGADLGAHTQGRLGTRGADSKFSQRMQFAVPNDYYDLLEEDEEEIDEDYVVENTRYSLKNILEADDSIRKLTSRDHLWWENKIKDSIRKLSNKEKKKFLIKKLDDLKTEKASVGQDLNPEIFIEFIVKILKENFLDDQEKMLFTRTLKDRFGRQDFLFEIIILKFVDLLRGDEKIEIGNGKIFPEFNFKTPQLDQNFLVEVFFKSFVSLDRPSFEEELRNTLKDSEKDNYVANPALYVLSHWAKREQSDKIPEKLTLLLRNYYISNPKFKAFKKILINNKPIYAEFIKKQVAELQKAILEIDSISQPESELDSAVDDTETVDPIQPEEAIVIDPVDIPALPTRTTNTTDKSSLDKEDLPIEEYAKFKKDASEYVKEVTAEVFLRDVASLVFGLGDEVVGVARIVFNLYFQIRKSNNEILEQKEIINEYLKKLETENLSKESNRKFHIKIIKEQIIKLQKLQQSVLTDLTDVIQGVISLIPDDVIGPLAAIETSLGKVSEFLPNILGKYLDTLKTSDLTQIEMIIKKDSGFKPIRYIMLFLSGIKFLSNFSMFPLSLLSFVNINIFNPIGIFVRGFQSLFITAELQKSLIIASKRLENNGIEYFDSSVPQSDVSISNIPTQDPVKRDKFKGIVRKLFYTKPGDTSIYQDLFSESLEKRSLIYLIEEYEIVDEDIDGQENEIDEFSSGPVAGFSLPLGSSPRGPKNIDSSNSGGEIYPYTKSDRKKFHKFSKKTLGALSEHPRY